MDREQAMATGGSLKDAKHAKEKLTTSREGREGRQGNLTKTQGREDNAKVAS